jgi:hypothetical protein
MPGGGSRSCPEPGGGTDAAGTRGTPGAALSWEVGAGATGARGAPGVALRREAGTGTQVTHGDPGAALSREVGTTPLPPLLRPSVGGPGVVVPVTPLDNPHRMITRGKTSFKVVPARLVLTVAIASLTPFPIPSSAHAVLAMEEEYGALINNGTWELVP